MTDCPIIGCGGVSSADDVRAFFDAGASVVGVGSALVGLTTDEIAAYFRTLSADLERGGNRRIRSGGQARARFHSGRLPKIYRWLRPQLKNRS